MTEPIFFKREAGLTIREIAAITGAEARHGARLDHRITDLAALDRAGPGDLVFLDSLKHASVLAVTHAGACLTTERLDSQVPPHVCVLRTPRPYDAFLAVAHSLFPQSLRPSSLFEATGVAAGAFVHPTARLESGVTIDPGVVVGPRAEIGAGTVLAAGAVVGPDVRIGRDCSIGAGAAIVHALIGDRVAIRGGSRIGQDGSGHDGSDHDVGPRSQKLPQLGRVIVQDGVEIGANCTIERGELSDTVIGEGAKIDNLVQIGHNVVIGRHCILRSQAGVAEGVRIGDHALLGRQVGVAGHLAIGERAEIAARSDVTDNVPAGASFGGHRSNRGNKGEGQ